MNNKKHVIVVFRLDWLMRIYLKSIIIFCQVTGMTPNVEKIRRNAYWLISHGVTVYMDD